MTQWNLWKVVPFMVSSRGWGVLWDTNYATAHLNKVNGSEAVQLGPWRVRPVRSSDPSPTRAYNSTPANWSEATATFTCTVAGPKWIYMQMPELIWCSHAARVSMRQGGVAAAPDSHDGRPCHLQVGRGPDVRVAGP